MDFRKKYIEIQRDNCASACILGTVESSEWFEELFDLFDIIMVYETYVYFNQ